MTRHVLMILPDTEAGTPRLVGPFLTEATATAWADREGIDQVRRMIRELEEPTSIYGYGRHALIPSPTPRRVVGEALAAWEAKKEQARAESGRPIMISGERLEHGGHGGIVHWVTGEAMESAPHNVLSDAPAIAHWSGALARFNSPTTDGRVLELNGMGAGDWMGHFVRVPVGVWVMVPNVGALPIGLCERVRVEDGWLLGEGRVSIGHFQKAAPELLGRVWPTDAGDGTVPVGGSIPAAVDVTNGHRNDMAGAIKIGGPWELERVVFGSVPAWPGCAVRFDEVEMGAIRG